MTDPKDLPKTATMRRMKRSRVLHVSSLMATASFSLAACGSPQRVAAPEPEPTPVYTSLDECRAANDISDAECDAAQAAAQKAAAETAPRYATQSECEGQWGPSQCQPNNSGGGSFFTPLLAGFVVGQMLNGGGYRGGGPIYRDRNNQYSNGYGGGYAYRDYRTGKTLTNGREYGDVARQAPSRVQSRTTVVSRGGFGGGGRGYGG
ncbi:DUF1190 domain-containing protein [Brevundimonas bullata]|jgi:uncharacterized protein YgiB involved in biofilm formation|uniref:DUF1190 domain-containing protein n=1 Tax=Brevundimonas bullata TaxID=13160 RepID=UPI000FB07C3B|nr:DUF1190 domain-containing protein [Brevundimonas bullata]WQE35413.1 DUF1190 domain-containing protein [Brevundimonas bullata]